MEKLFILTTCDFEMANESLLSETVSFNNYEEAVANMEAAKARMTEFAEKPYIQREEINGRDFDVCVKTEECPDEQSFSIERVTDCMGEQYHAVITLKTVTVGSENSEN